MGALPSPLSRGPARQLQVWRGVQTPWEEGQVKVKGHHPDSCLIGGDRSWSVHLLLGCWAHRRKCPHPSARRELTLHGHVVRVETAAGLGGGRGTQWTYLSDSVCCAWHSQAVGWLVALMSWIHAHPGSVVTMRLGTGLSSVLW